MLKSWRSRPEAYMNQQAFVSRRSDQVIQPHPFVESISFCLRAVSRAPLPPKLWAKPFRLRAVSRAPFIWAVNRAPLPVEPWAQPLCHDRELHPSIWAVSRPLPSKLWANPLSSEPWITCPSAKPWAAPLPFKPWATRFFYPSLEPQAPFARAIFPCLVEPRLLPPMPSWF